MSNFGAPTPTLAAFTVAPGAGVTLGWGYGGWGQTFWGGGESAAAFTVASVLRSFASAATARAFATAPAITGFSSTPTLAVLA